MQCTSVRLLLNLVEVIYSRRADVRAIEQHRALLAKALDAFVSKLSALRRALPRLMVARELSCHAMLCWPCGRGAALLAALTCCNMRFNRERRVCVHAGACSEVA